MCVPTDGQTDFIRLDWSGLGTAIDGYMGEKEHGHVDD
jgi:hypothetical protein